MLEGKTYRILNVVFSTLCCFIDHVNQKPTFNVVKIVRPVNQSSPFPLRYICVERGIHSLVSDYYLVLMTRGDKTF